MVSLYVAKYARVGILLDTNLLILFLVGLFDSTFIPIFKRTAMYTEEDFKKIEKFIKNFRNIFVTPQILAELWNLLEKIEGESFQRFLESAIPQLLIITENYIHKNCILNEESIKYIGLTDMSIILTAKELNCLVLTDDFRAHSHFEKNGIAAININHLRLMQS